jgi:hypothetical protein
MTKLDFGRRQILANMEAQRQTFYVDGFPSLANFIASDKDGTSTIFKRFNRLAARNLLILQSELAELQAKLDEYDCEDREGGAEALQSLRNWEDYKARNEKDSDRMKILEKIRTTLKDYSTRPNLKPQTDAYGSYRRSHDLREHPRFNTTPRQKDTQSISNQFLSRKTRREQRLADAWRA